MNRITGLAALFAAALLTAPAWADSIDDPLHGYVLVGGVPTNTDNGVFVPLNCGASCDFGFFVSPAPATGTFGIAIITPTSSPPLASVAITGTFAGTATLHSGSWTSGELATFLGEPPASPTNNVNAWGGSGGYFVDFVNFGTATLLSLADSTMVEHIANGILPPGSLILGFLAQGATTIATANSGALLPGGSQVPIPGAVWLFGTGLVGLIAMNRKKAKRLNGLGRA